MQLVITIILITFIYHCNAGNNLEPPRVISGDSSKTVQQGEDLTLSCIFSGSPTPRVTWEKNDIVIQSARVQHFSSYTISNANPNDNGEYVCEGVNSEGTVSSTFTVRIESTTDRTESSQSTTETVTRTTTTTTPSVNLEVPTTSLRVSEPGYYSGNFKPVVYVGQGRTLTMYCRVTGNPQPTTLWYKGNTIVKRGSNMYRQYYFSSRNEAVYRCEAFNNAGSDSTSVDVRLGAPLTITSGPGSRYSRVGDAVTLRVTLSRQTDFEISWYRIVDNSLIKLSQRNGIYFLANKKRMDIVPLRAEHAGDYSVRAESQWETVSYNFSIYMYTVVTTTRPNEDTPFTAGSTLELPCSYYGYPSPTVKWYYNSQILDPSVSDRFNLSEENALSTGPLGEREDGDSVECRIRDGTRQWRIVYTLELGTVPEMQTTNCDVDLCRGRNVKLICEANSDTSLKYSWYKTTDPNTRIYPSSKYKLYANGKLEIVNSNLNDLGTYKCRASNKFGSDSIACRVRTTPGPSLVSREQRILKTIGRSTKIYCRVYGALETRITWYKDENEAIPQDVAISKQVSGLTTQSILSFPQLDTQHAGNYTCVVSSCANGLEQTHKLNVRQNIEITRTPHKFNFCRGKTVTFPCEATGFPEPVISWYFNGEIIISGQNGFYINEQNSLSVINSPSNKTGYYRCRASNPFSWRTISFRAIFQEIEPPNFQEREQPLPALAEDFCLTCLPTNYRINDTYTWHKQDDVIESSSKYNISNGWQLCITNFQTQDLGTYKCEVTNCVGTSAKTFSIDSYKDQPTTPNISTTRMVYTILEGRTLRLLCRASGYPTPSISWYYGEGRISGNNHYSLDELPNLRITNAVRALHSGIYKCRADNTAGSDILSISMIVYQPPRLRRIRSQFVDLGVKACFDCYVTKGYPAPTVEWTKNGEVIGNQGRMDINQGNHTLCISEVTSSDKGKYRCTVRNIVGSAYVEATLNVKTCGLLSFVTTPRNHTASVGDLLSIQCPIQPNIYECPTKLIWREVTRGTKGLAVTIQEHDPRLSGSILMLRVNINNTGQYQCIAYNDHSTIAQRHVVTIVSPPWEIPFNRRQVFRANSDVNLNCPIRGVPQPSYTWRLGDSELEPGDNLIINDDHVTINNAAVSNTGLYSCRGRNQYGHWEVRLEVTICGEINMEFTGDSEVEERSWTAFTCSLREETIPNSVEFFIGFERMNVTGLQTNKFRYSRPNEKTAELNIVRARQEDSGPVICRINTTCGSSERTIILQVTATEGSKLRLANNQITHPGAILPNCHNRFTLQCPVVGSPRPKYKWYFNDTKINFNRSPNIVSKRGRKEITVHDPDVSAAGGYRCEATNTQGIIRYTYYISVRLPRVPNGFQRYAVFEGQSLSLGCNSTLLANRKWSKNLRSVNISNFPFSNDLVFESVERGDGGVYFCCARSGRDVYTYVSEVQVQT